MMSKLTLLSLMFRSTVADSNVIGVLSQTINPGNLKTSLQATLGKLERKLLVSDPPPYLRQPLPQ